MNAIRQTQALNKRELENAVPPEASWHADYRDTAYIYIGGLPFDISEGDIVTIFSQYGEPVHVNLIRDKETGKSRGFAFLKYEDQRSTDLAVDNLGGATVLGRILRVDHARYKKRDDEEEGGNVAKLMGETVDRGSRNDDTDDERERRKERRPRNDEPRSRPLLKEEKELQELMATHDEEDPMKEYLIEEKKEEVARALERLEKNSSRERSSRHHRHRHHHHRHDEDRSRSRERRHRRDRSPSREERSYRDRPSSIKEKSYKDRSPVRSRSPDSRRHRDRESRRR
ncbi:uncharacterized protein ACLA_012010 [Aspergillus clavatus NRRL 1]|uniref:RNA binding domain protein n=1 Tax=Aspergillus clavatus (strain ATCC 1007 / CBS 513.65 / DSM 816 / NCTC 3887 / NRRL 1 / QM 1276 / 107) TaxID=344612 RepID=A1CAK5_ASPCL|nr:RNA binding domain protein [Aspergillus clavatus NRRL 1]EAW12773.1 RNA binding domain protein [Aspergillus clavatus NRRL 1]